MIDFPRPIEFMFPLKQTSLPDPGTPEKRTELCEKIAGIQTWWDAKEFLAQEWHGQCVEAVRGDLLCQLAEDCRLDEFAVRLEREGLALAGRGFVAGTGGWR